MKISFTADRDEIVETAEVASVIPNSAASRRDVEIHDELLAIDHVSIKGMKYEDARILIDRDLKAGEERTFIFYGRRDFLISAKFDMTL